MRMTLIATLAMMIAAPAWAVDRAAVETLSANTTAITVPVPAPAGPLLLEGGDTIALADLKGQTIVATFWATWCHVCAEEMPKIAALQAETREGLTVLPISVDDGDALTKVRQHVDRHPDIADLPVVVDPNAAMFQQVGAFATPTTVIIDKFGQVVVGFIGAVDWDAPVMADYLSALIAAETADASRAILAQ